MILLLLSQSKNRLEDVYLVVALNGKSDGRDIKNTGHLVDAGRIGQGTINYDGMVIVEEGQR